MNYAVEYPRTGEIYNAYFEESSTHCQSGWRPALVIQNNIGNKHSPNVIVLPLTSSIKKLNMPTHVVLSSSDTGLYKDSMVICENPQSISKNNLGKYITKLSDKYMEEVAQAYLESTPLLGFIKNDKIQEIKEKTNLLVMSS